MTSGMNLRDALRLWRKSGGTVESRKGTGEVVCRHPRLEGVIVHNNRRKDASRELTTALKRIMKA